MNTIALRPWELAAYMREKKLLVVRPVKPQFTTIWGRGVRHGEDVYSIHVDIMEPDGSWRWIKCPVGKPGEVLGIKEAFDWAAGSISTSTQPTRGRGGSN